MKNIIIYFEIIADMLVMSLAFLLANIIKFNNPFFSDNSRSYSDLYAVVVVTYVVVYMFLSINGGNMATRKAMKELIVVVKHHVYMAFLIFGFMFATQSNQFYSRVQLGIFLVLSTIFVFITRQVYKEVVVRIYNKTNSGNKVMLVTTSDRAADVISQLHNSRDFFFQIVGLAIMDKDMMDKDICGIPVIANEKNIVKQSGIFELQSVFVHVSDDAKMDVEKLVNIWKDMGLTVHVNLHEYHFAGGIRRLSKMGGCAVVTYVNHEYKMSYIILKRGMDLMIGFVGSILAVIAIPFVMVSISLESPGPTIISTTRVGKNGKRFKLYKFRTMYMDAEIRSKEARKQGISEEVRYTKTGTFLKRSGIAGWPMFFNILAGDLSVVGTKPPSEAEVLQQDVEERKRISIKPGITGEWLIEQCKSQQDVYDMVYIDNSYIDKWSLWYDIKILGQTLKLTVFGK